MDYAVSSFLEEVFSNDDANEMWPALMENDKDMSYITKTAAPVPYIAVGTEKFPDSEGLCKNESFLLGDETDDPDTLLVANSMGSSFASDLSWLDEGILHDSPFSTLDKPSLSSSVCGASAEPDRSLSIATSQIAVTHSVATTSPLEHFTAGNTSPGCPPRALTDEELAKISVPELELRFAGSPGAPVAAMKRRRRMLLNRRYARNSRSRKASKDQTTLSEVDQLRQDRDKWKLRAEALMLELKAYKKAN